MRPKLQKCVKRRGKSLLPAVIDYRAWRKGDTYVLNHRLGAPRMHPKANRKTSHDSPSRCQRLDRKATSLAPPGLANNGGRRGSKPPDFRIGASRKDQHSRCYGRAESSIQWIKCCRGLRTSIFSQRTAAKKPRDAVALGPAAKAINDATGSADRIASHPLASAGENSCAVCPNRLVP